MQKSAIMLILSGMLIVIGLILFVVGNQVILEGVSQSNGMVSFNQDLEISGEFSSKVTHGVFAVQITDFKDNTFSAIILDPSGIEITSEMIQSDITEKEFEIEQIGDYRLIIQSNSNEESQVFGAIGPLPDAGKKALGFISTYILTAGMLGLVVTVIYGIKKKSQFR